MNLLRRPSLWAAVLILVIFFQAFFTIRVKSLTFDEPFFIPAGYSYLLTGDFRLNPEHPPLAKLLVALPLLWIHPQPALPLDDPGWRVREEWSFLRAFFERNRMSLESITFWARLPIVLLAPALGLVIYRWASALYGVRAGLFSLFLLAFEPNVIAHTSLATTDMALTLFMLIAFYTLWRYYRDPRPVTMLWMGFAFSLAQASKFSAVILFFLFSALLFLIHLGRSREGWRGREVRRLAAAWGYAFLKTAGAMFVVTAITGSVLFVLYGCRLEDAVSRAEFNADTDRYIALTHNPVKVAGYEAIKVVHVPLRYYLEGFRKIMFDFRRGYESYVMGRLTKGGVWYYFPLAILIKTPIPLLFLFALGIAFALIRWRSLNSWFFLIPVAAILGFSLHSRVQIGLRHVLPIFPFLVMMGGAAADRWLLSQGWIRRSLVGLLGAWLVFSSASTFPQYLSYFNELVGGPKNGHLYLVDSNLDWGQDLKLLKAYMERNHLSKINLFYFGSIDPGLYGINYETPSWQAGASPPGVYAISKQVLYFEKLTDGRYDYFRSHPSQDRAGWSILIFKVP